MYTNLSSDKAVKKLMKGDGWLHWSWDGAKALIEYLENLEDSLDEPIKFDKVAFQCEYSEYESVPQAAEHYGFDADEYGFDADEGDEIEAAALKYLEDRTTVIQFEGGVIIKEY